MDIFYWDFMHDIQKVQKLVQNNAIVAGESDTVIGLFGNCTREAFAALNRIKHRSSKPYIILVASPQKALLFVDESQHNAFVTLSTLFWPGPYTIIVKTNTLFSYATSETREIALRVPDKAEIRFFLSSFCGVFSTSANITGEPIPGSFDRINPDIKRTIAGYIQFKNPPKKVPPSTLIRLHNRHIAILRGSLSSQQKALLVENGFIFETD